MHSLSIVLTVLSAMLTPAILIMASGSLSLTTSNRLSRSIDRVRKISEKLENAAEEGDAPLQLADKEFVIRQLLYAIRRSRLLQGAMSCLYVALSIFVGTIIGIGLFEVMGLKFAWVLLLLGFLGVLLLLFACILLILESRVALRAVNAEMDHTAERFLFPKPARPAS